MLCSPHLVDFLFALQNNIWVERMSVFLFFQCFTEDSDELWMRHCQRDFKRESPQEYESWREMYLRLHDEREERLRMLTQNITSAHANKPKGRRRFHLNLEAVLRGLDWSVFTKSLFTCWANQQQKVVKRTLGIRTQCIWKWNGSEWSVFLIAGRQVKMAYVNSVAKPPRDIRRRQEKFGTSSGSSTAASIAAAPIKSVSYASCWLTCRLEMKKIENIHKTQNAKYLVTDFLNLRIFYFYSFVFIVFVSVDSTWSVSFILRVWSKIINELCGIYNHFKWKHPIFWAQKDFEDSCSHEGRNRASADLCGFQTSAFID